MGVDERTAPAHASFDTLKQEESQRQWHLSIIADAEQAVGIVLMSLFFIGARRAVSSMGRAIHSQLFLNAMRCSIGNRPEINSWNL